jgi:hypothetical protein
VFIEVGPAALVVRGEKDGSPFEFDRERVEGLVTNILSDIGDCLPILKQKAYKIKKTASLPDVARLMVEAVKVVDGASLTPMAAVAGSVADRLRDYLKTEALDFLSINNGGDISVFNPSGRPVSIGLGDIQRNRPTPYSLRIEGLTEFGIATSGFGGRSFTLGVADVVSVIASSGALADAAATFICNCTAIPSEQVVRQRAGEIDAGSDIADELVTVQVGPLDAGLVREALEKGRTAAQALKRANAIVDAVLLLRDEMATTIEDNTTIRLEVHNGDQETSDGGGGHFL